MKAYFWQSPAGLMTGWYDFASKWLFEDKTDLNPPRAARAYALLATVCFDAFLATNDGKYAYWYLRPHQLDPGITPYCLNVIRTCSWIAFDTHPYPSTSGETHEMTGELSTY